MIANVPIYPVDSVIQPFEQLGPDRWTIFSYLILWRLVINLHGKNWVWCARNMCFWIPIYLPVEHCWFWPCRQYLKEKKINFHIKMKMCEKKFFKTCIFHPFNGAKFQQSYKKLHLVKNVSNNTTFWTQPMQNLVACDLILKSGCFSQGCL